MKTLKSFIEKLRNNLEPHVDKLTVVYILKR